MADCRDIQLAVATGRSLEAPDLRAHAAECAACRAIAEDDGSLGRALSTRAPDEGAVDLDGMFAELQGRVAEERGLGAWLRSRPTPARIALAATATLVAMAGLGLILPGRDLASVPPVPGVGSLGASVAVALGAVVVALWPLHRARPPRAVGAALLTLAVGIPVLAALWPPPPSAIVASQAGGLLALKCFGLGSLTALPVLLVVRGADRAPWGVSVVLAGAAAGLAGTAGLALGCPHSHPLHLLLGHATVAAAYVGAGAALAALRGARAG